MKFLYLYMSRNIGGVCTQLVNRFKYLKNFSEVHFVFFHDYCGINIFGGYPNIHIMDNCDDVARYINENKFDVISIIDTNEMYKAVEKSNFKGLIIDEVHTTYPKNLNKLNSLRQTCPMHAIITPSKYLRSRILHEFKFYGIRDVYLVENCLDTNLFENKNIRPYVGKKIILWVGKLDTLKNWKWFLKIAYIIKQKRRDCEFWLVGGYTAPKKIINEMKWEVSKLGLSNDFKWIPRIEYENMPNIYSLTAKSGGVYLSTTQNESFGMTIVEAMACKCPVVASNVGGIPEILNDELNFSLYELNNAYAAAYKIEYLMENKIKREKLVNLASERAKQRYSIEKIGKKYLQILDKLII